MQLKWHYRSCGWRVSISISSNTLCHGINHNQFHQLCATLRALNVLEIFNQKNAFKLPTFIGRLLSHTIVLFDHAKCGDKFEKSLNSIFLSFHFLSCNRKKSILLSENLFLFNLRDKCFWQLTEVSIANISSIKFVPTHFHKKQKKKQDDDNNNNEDFNGDWSNSSSTNLLMGNKSGFIYEIEISKYNNNSSSSS